MKPQRTLQARLLESLRIHGDRIAVQHLETALPYRDLDRHSDIIAHWLVERGIPRGASIGLLLDDRVSLITCIIAILKAGCVFVPLDFHYPGARVRAMLEVADLSYIMTEERNFRRVKAITNPLERRLDIVTVGDRFYLEHYSAPAIHEDIYKLSHTEKIRYKRQILLDGWGLEGQERLKGATVFVAGAGGSGSPLIQQLALCGFGTIVVCDFDHVELSNLNRQSLHDESRIGMNKALSAKLTVETLNPHVTVVAKTEKITRENVFDLVGRSEIIFDNVDSLEAKSVLGECAVQLGIPHIISSMIHINSYACVFHTPHTPCFHCLYDREKIQDISRAKTNAGHYEVIPNSVASPSLYLSTGFAVGEAVKILLGMGAPAYNRYMHFNQYGDEAVAGTNGYRQITYPFNNHFRRLAEEQGFSWDKGWSGRLVEEIRIEPDPGCPVCSRTRVAVEQTDMDRQPPSVDYFEDDRVNIYFTSGTTGKPKAVVGRNESLLHFIAWEIGEFELQPGCRVSQLTPPCHDPFLRDIFVPLCCGGTVCVPDSRETILEHTAISQWLQCSAVNLVHCTPSLFKIINGNGVSANCFPQLHYILLAGEKVEARALASWYEKIGERVQLVNIYGPTETTLAKLFHRVTPADLQRDTIPIGKAIRGSKAVLVDSDDNLCAVGQVGEILIRTPFRSHGYCNDPEATARKFVPNPFGDNPSDVVYRTGDLARLNDDGDIEFVGRKDRQIKIRGFRVELEGIERTLRLQPEVEDVVVLDKTTGTGNKILAAYVIPRCNGEPLEDDWLAAVKEGAARELPDYMIPSFFIPMDAFPLNANKKIDYRALPDPGHVERRDFAAPSTAVEKNLAAIWSEVLGIEQIGVSDGFLDMGGNSLNAMTLAARVFGDFGVNVPLQKMFENPTIRNMAAWVADIGIREAPPVEPLEKKEYYPLSGAQKRMYLLREFSGKEDTSYNMPKPVLLEGTVDRDRLATALQLLVDRHEALRTSFIMVAGEPAQVVADRVDVTLAYEVADDSPNLANRYIRPFDLSKAPLMRATLVKTSAERHLLVFDIHHIISDGVTTGVLIRDYMRLYNREELPPLRVQYKDYAAWQRHRSLSPDLKRQELYWMKQFAQPAPPLELTTDFPRPAVQQNAGATLAFDVAEDLLERLETLGRRYDATLFMVLLSCYTALLYRYSGQNDMVVGFPIAGRSHQDLEGIAGIFINTLALRCAPAGDKTFSGFLQEVRNAAFAAYDNQEFQFDDLVEKVKVERRLDRNPLLDVMMIMQNIDQQPFQLEDLTIAPLDFDSGVSRFDLTLTAIETPNGRHFAFEYATSLFRTETIARMAGHLINIMAAVSQEGTLRLDQMPMLGREEVEEILHNLNDTSVFCPESDFCRAALSQMDAAGQQVALTAISHKGPSHLSNAYLRRRAFAVAAELGQRGVRPGDIVAVKLGRQPDLLAILLGVMTAGAAYLPIDPALPSERIRFMLADSAAALLIEDADWAVALPDHPETVTAVPASADPLRPAYLMYTSGSTGTPKGVMVNHRNVMNFLSAMKRRLDCSYGKVLALTTISFDISVLELFLPLFCGMSMTLADEAQQKDAALLTALLEREPVNILQITPSRLAAFLGNRRLAALLARVPQLVVGGEALSEETLAALSKIRRGAGRVYNVYGPTETTVWSCIVDLTGARCVTIGRPLDNTSVFILDARQNLLPRGVAGELCIGGLGVANGYLNRQDLTAERFIHHRQTGMRLYRTGDLAKWLPDGHLQFLGRLDFQVKIRGFRIETEEIRHHLLSHSLVSEALVAAVGENGDLILCAYIVPIRPDETETPERDESLRLHLRCFLPEYMIPSIFITLEALPLTPSGKIDRKALPLPGTGKSREWAGPSGPLEESLLRIWNGVLGGDSTSAPPFGVEDNFFAVGGHSLKALSLLSRLEERHHVRMPMAELFRHPTIRAMAAWIEGAVRGNGARIEAGEVLDYYPLSFYQERLWILQGLNPESCAYNMTQVLPLPEGCDGGAVKRAFAELMERHDSLRAYFVEKDGRPVQKIAPPVPIPLSLVSEGQSVANAATESRNRPFQLWRPPLVRLALVEVPDGSYLVATLHHIIADAWSMGILQQEFDHYLNGEISETGESPMAPDLQYQDFGRWHAARIADPDFKERALRFWLKRLEGGVPILQFPMAARGDLEDQRGIGYRDLLDHETMARLEELAAREHTTSAIVMLAVFFICLSIVTRQTDLACALITAGRDQEILKRTVGYFTNALLMRVTLAEDEEFNGFLARVGEEMMQIMEYQHFPLELAAQEAGVETPRMQAAFNMLNVNPRRLQDQRQTPHRGFLSEGVAAKFPVELYVEPSTHGLVLDWVFQQSFFDQEGIRFFAGTFADVLAQCLSVE